MTEGYTLVNLRLVCEGLPNPIDIQIYSFEIKDEYVDFVEMISTWSLERVLANKWVKVLLDVLERLNIIKLS